MCQFITVKELPALGYLYIMYEHSHPECVQFSGVDPA